MSSEDRGIFKIILANAFLPLGYLIFHWDQSGLLFYFLVESVIIGLSANFKMKTAVNTTYMYFPPPEVLAKEKLSRDGSYHLGLNLMYALYTVVYGALVLWFAGTGLSHWYQFAIMVGALSVSQAGELFRYYNQKEGTRTTVGMITTVLVKRMTMMLFLGIMSSSLENSAQIVSIFTIVSVGLDLYYFNYINKHSAKNI